MSEAFPNATIVGGSAEYSKEQQDLALAVVVLRSGLLTERQFSSALFSWTIHGSVPLGEHLRSKGLLDEAQHRKILQQASDQLASKCDAKGDCHNPASQSVLISTLDHLDPSGTVARMLGIRAVAGVGAADAIGHRSSTCRYRFVRKLGQGGLGCVWLAFDEQLRRHVAVKEIRAADNPAAVERFRREAEITGRLEHPGIVPIYQLGEDARTGEIFYAMRFLGKKTLHDAVQEYHERRAEGNDAPMLIRQLLMDFINICQAIGHAHSRKVIHRDLKPENVAIDSFGQVIVIDWGIAKVVDELHLSDAISAQPTAAASGQSTLQGQVLGTPLYMAPEQAAGRIDELDERTDIYGLGAILYAILTGVAPHEQTRDAAAASTGRELLSAITSRPTPHPREVRPDVDEALAAICEKAMARRQYNRYQTASQLADDVQRWMAGEPVSAYRERFGQRVTRWVQAHRLWSQLIAAALTVFIVGLVTRGVAARNNRIVQKQLQFESMRSYAREIEVQVRSAADELAKDVRFMSIVPSVQEILGARAGAAGSEGEAIWVDRLNVNYEGLLRANPDYLSVSFVVMDKEQQAIELVRVERNPSDPTTLRRIPASRLEVYSDQELATKASKLSPGDVLVHLRQPDFNNPGVPQGVRLLISTPVFDELGGKFSGIVLVETDLREHLSRYMARMDQQSARIDITGPLGNIWVSDDPQTGIEFKTRKTPIADRIAALGSFYSSMDEARREDRSAGWIASRIRLDPTDPKVFMVVVSQLVASP